MIQPTFDNSEFGEVETIPGQQRIRKRGGLRWTGLLAVLVWSSLLFATYAALTDADPTTKPLIQPAQHPVCPADRNYQIVPSPFFEEDRTVFLGDRDRLALWRSTDAGITWTQVISSGLPFEAWVTHVEIPSVQSSSGLKVYVLYYYDTGYGGGTMIVRSSDSGDTWDLARPFFSSPWGDFRATNQVGMLFASTTSGLFRSDDDTLAWQHIMTGTTVYGIFPSPTFADDQTLFATFSHQPGPGLHISQDGGMTWEERQSGICDYNWIHELAFSHDFSDDQTLFAIEAGHEFIRSQDGGQSWLYLYPQDEPPCQLHNDGAYKVQVSPDYPGDRTVFMSTGTALYISYDDGIHWRRVINGSSFWFSVSRRPEAQLRSTYFPLALGGGQMPAHRIYLPLLAAQGELPMERPLTLFASSAAGENYRSDDGGITWQCLNLPPAEPQDTTTN